MSEERLGNVANRLLFENELVRVWEMRLAPGERSDRHRHDLPYLLCVVAGSRVDAEVEGSGRIEIPVQPGSVFFVPPGATETAINAGSDAFREILIELKQAGTGAPKLAMANTPGPPRAAAPAAPTTARSTPRRA
jgi:quercetin dioxygenase-like cupin family protein